jgi:hypothetical protein
MKTETREGEFPSHGRVAFKKVKATPGQGTKVGIPLCWSASLTNVRRRSPFQEQAGSSAVRPS